MAQTRLGVLDGMRGIAVLLVLWYHVWEISWLPARPAFLEFVPETGFAGVDLFFFISGFVIAYPFMRALALGEAPMTWGRFAYRRARKIVPSYVLSIGIAIAIGYAQFTGPADASRALLTHLFFIHTWWPDTYGSINGVLWTLGVEVQFYVLFPLLWSAFSRSPWLTAAAMTAAAMLFRMHAVACCVHNGAEQMVFNLGGYLDMFAAGMISAHLYVRWDGRAQTPAVRALATAGAFAGIAGTIALLENLYAFRFAPDWSTVWSAHYRTLLALSFACIATGSLLGAAWWKRTLLNPVLLFFAAISYNLYLYHQMIARELLRWHLPGYAGQPHADPDWQMRFTEVSFALTIAQATIVTYLFERPLLRLPPEAWRKLIGGMRHAYALRKI